MNSAALVTIAVALALWGRGVVLLLSLPRYKKPDVDWHDVHPLAGTIRCFIAASPDSLTDEGKRKLLSATRAFGLCAAVVIVGVALSIAIDRWN